MVVITTDSTATDSTDGGNLTDVSDGLRDPGGATATFQGTALNHTMLIGSAIEGEGETLKHFGIKIAQTVAAVGIGKPFVMEIWDGSAWAKIGAMSSHSSKFYRYGNDLFLRKTSEHLRYGVDETSPWLRKSINGHNLYWARIRIVGTVTTAPVFDQFKLSPNRTEINEDGTSTYHGNARFRQTLVMAGNLFGESGGVSNASVPIGSGSIPQGWNHRMKNNQLNGNGDAIYAQFTLPHGIDTSQRVKVRIIYQVEQAGATTVDASIVVSLQPLQVVGTVVADPNGGVVPTKRTVANTVHRNARPATIHTESIAVGATDSLMLRSFETNGVDVSDYYEGDILAVRIELDNDGSPNKDILIWSAEIDGAKWTLGEKL